MINRIIEFIQDFWEGKPELGARSSGWSKLRNQYIEENPFCAVCLTTKKLEVHHIYLASEFPEMELSWGNLITLCRQHHYEWGHYYNWRRGNYEVREMAKEWREKVDNRP